jgi:hypothetical protein
MKKKLDLYYSLLDLTVLLTEISVGIYTHGLSVYILSIGSRIETVRQKNSRR